MTTKSIYLLLVSLSCCVSALAQRGSTCGTPTPAELVDKKFLALPGCRAGNVYQTTTLVGYCTCWYQAGQKCGYICDNSAIPAPGSAQTVLVNGGISIRRKTLKVRVRRQATCPPSPLPANSRYVAMSRGCLVGNSYSTSTELCTCCGNVGYTCTLTNPPTTAAPSTTTAVPTTSTTTVPPTTAPPSTTTPAPACPPSPFPANAVSYIPDQGCTVLAESTTQAILINGGAWACVCTSPVQCGMLCYSLEDGSNPSG